MILLGFMLFLVGIVGILLDLVGLQFAFLLWMDQLGKLGSFLVKLVMLFGGIVLMYLYATDWKRQEREDYERWTSNN